MYIFLSTINPFIVSATRRSRDIKIQLSVGPRSEKFNIVSNDHERTQRCDFCIPVCQTNFTDHHTPHTIMKYDTRFSMLSSGL